MLTPCQCYGAAAGTTASGGNAFPNALVVVRETFASPTADRSWGRTVASAGLTRAPLESFRAESLCSRRVFGADVDV
jgi:hypothetical protein